jgi:hypothetical protein
MKKSKLKIAFRNNKLRFLVLLPILLLNGCMSSNMETSSHSKEFPEFPWPPPQASASMMIPDSLIKNGESELLQLGQVSDRLTNALNEAGYSEKSFYAVPDGFAIVTRMEQIEADGTPKIPGRWDINTEPMSEFSLKQYLKALFYANPGLFRIVVLIITPHPFYQSEDTIGRDEAMKWLKGGLNRLPDSIAVQEYTKSFTTTALIYEFIKPESGDAVLSQPSKLDGREHVEKSGLIKNLAKL